MTNLSSFLEPLSNLSHHRTAVPAVTVAGLPTGQTMVLRSLERAQKAGPPPRRHITNLDPEGNRKSEDMPHHPITQPTQTPEGNWNPESRGCAPQSSARAAHQPTKGAQPASSLTQSQTGKIRSATFLQEYTSAGSPAFRVPWSAPYLGKQWETTEKTCWFRLQLTVGSHLSVASSVYYIFTYYVRSLQLLTSHP